jgi:hypothetical protein
VQKEIMNEIWKFDGKALGKRYRNYITNTERCNSIIISNILATYFEFILLVCDIISKSIMTFCSICKPIRREWVKISSFWSAVVYHLYQGWWIWSAKKMYRSNKMPGGALWLPYSTYFKICEHTGDCSVFC